MATKPIICYSRSVSHLLSPGWYEVVVGAPQVEPGRAGGTLGRRIGLRAQLGKPEHRPQRGHSSPHLVGLGGDAQLLQRPLLARGQFNRHRKKQERDEGEPLLSFCHLSLSSFGCARDRVARYEKAERD